MSETRSRLGFLRLFGGAVVSQAAVSAASLLVSLILIRHQSAEQYGYYVLVATALPMLTGVQVGFLQPPMIIRLGRVDAAARRDLIGGLVREQRRILVPVGIAGAIITCALWGAGVLATPIALLVLAAVVAGMATLYREFFRMVLMGYRRPIDVLSSDLVYIVFFVAGAVLATVSPLPAATAVVTLALAAAIGGTQLAKALWRHEPWRIDGAPGILREMAPVGAWSVAGAEIHWAFSQGYTYLVAASLDIQTVAALAATRLLLMPVNLMSSGMFQMMLPTASSWLHQHGAATLHRRLLLFCAGVSVLAICYFGVMWLARDWIFAHVLRKDFAKRDTLLFLWFLIFLFMLLRDQLAPLLVARARLRQMTAITSVSAAIALTASYIGMGRFGAPGALVGVLIGEVLNVSGVAVLSSIESRRPSEEQAKR